MLTIGQVVTPNKILTRALSDSPNLRPRLKESLRRLSSLGCNPAKITNIKREGGAVTVTLQIQDSYSALPAVMCEGYNGGQGVACYFETEAQADLLLSSKSAVEFTNLSQDVIEAQQLVKLIYNNKNFVIMPAPQIKKVCDYCGVIGRARTKIFSYQTGMIDLLEISQAMDLNSFHELTIRHFGR